MGRYSNGSSSFFLGTWNQFMFCSSWLRLAGTTEPKTGSTHMSNEQPFDIRGSKLHHQIMLSACIFKHPMKKRITQIWPHRTPFTLPFPISNHLPPCLRSPCLSHKYPNSLPFKEIDLQLLFSFHRLVALRINSLATNFGIQCLDCRVLDKEN